MHDIIRNLGNLSKPILIISGYILVFLIGYIDYLTGPRFALSIFYLIPIILVTWFVGRLNGIALSVVSEVTLLIVARIGSNISLFSFSPVALWNAAVRFGFFMIIVLILSALKKAFELERELARTDDLTGIANRRSFFELSQMEIARLNRYGRTFSVAYTDIDSFKAINDGFGHSTGDALLHLVAETIKHNVREIDVVARLGGDEFAILLPETEREATQVILNRVRERLLEAMKENNWPVTFSIGVVTFVSPPASVDELLQKVDGLVYLAKTEGKNTIKFEEAVVAQINGGR